MNTNDEQAKYKATQKKAIVDMMRDAEADGLYDEVPRAPMFKLEDVKCAMKAQGWSCSDDEARKALHFIEAKITSGELRVVRLMSGNGIPNMTPTDTWTDSPWLCDDCGTEWMQRQNDIEVERPSFCPGCGAKIIE